MKSYILAILTILIFSSICLAQQEMGKFQVGIIAGPTHTFVRTSPERKDYESTFRAVTGATLQYDFDRFFLKTAILYESKGFILDYDAAQLTGSPKVDDTYEANLHYLTLPFLIGIRIMDTGLFVNTGPYAGILMKHTLVADHETRDNTSMLSRYDFGLSGGIGYLHSISPKFSISAEAIHHFGLYDLYANGLVQKTNSTNLQLGIHYTISNK
ncbi:MAG: porin family protein [Rufibacter sp.]